MTIRELALKDILERSDSGVWAKDAPDNGISILRSTNFRNDGDIDFADLAIKDVDPKDRERKMLLPGDILLEKSGGGPQQPVGRVVYFRGDNRPHVFGNFIARLRPIAEICDSRYLFWFLKYTYETGVAEKYQKQTTGIRNLETRRYFQISVPLLPLGDQRRIVGLLDRAAEVRRRADAASGKARDVTVALFVDMFGDPATNPKGWPSLPFGQVTNEFRYGTNQKCDDYASEGSVPVLRIPNVIGGQIDWLDIKHAVLPTKELEKTRLRSGDLLFVRTNGNPDYIGRCAFFDAKAEASYASYLIRARLTDSMSPVFVVHHFNHPRFRPLMLRKGKTTAGNYNLSVDGLSTLPVMTPPPSLQAVFAEQIQRIEGVARALDAAAAKAEAMAAALSAEVFGVPPSTSVADARS